MSRTWMSTPSRLRTSLSIQVESEGICRSSIGGAVGAVRLLWTAPLLWLRANETYSESDPWRWYEQPNLSQSSESESSRDKPTNQNLQLLESQRAKYTMYLGGSGTIPRFAFGVDVVADQYFASRGSTEGSYVWKASAQQKCHLYPQLEKLIILLVGT